MIWFFDSWFWWLQTMKYFYNLLPQYDYMFLADNKNCPFWNKSWKEIEDITFSWLNRLFDNWAKIVVIACNTAAAYSIRKWQTLYPHKKTLSVTVPWIEEILSKDSIDSVWIIATQATVNSNIYNDLYFRFWWKNVPDFHFVMAPKLVDAVENWQSQQEVLLLIKEHLLQLPKDISTLILGCTHFSVYKNLFSKLFAGIIIDPSFISAKKFITYLQNHQDDIKKNITRNWEIKFYTTWDKNNFDNIWSNIWWSKIDSFKIN